MKMDSITLTQTFSILCRIVWIVTFRDPCTHEKYRHFQYPVSDRLDCNAVATGREDAVAQLSVSCVGSSGL